MTYRTIVVGTDGSPTAQRAVDQAIKLAAVEAARIVFVTAFERTDRPSDESIPDDVRWMVSDPNVAERHARDGRERARDAGIANVVVQALEGAAAEQILETAEDFSADLIVVGSVGLTRSARFLLGSVASSVLHHAPCDVLVVHTH